MADGSVVFEILADDAKFKRAVSSLGTTTKNALKGASDALGSVGRGLTVGVTAPLAAAGVAVGKWALDTVSAAEQADIALSTMLGPERAKQMLSDLADFARTTPFEMSGLTQATQRLLAYGFAAEDVIPLLTSVGDATAGLGAGQEGIDAVTRALGQMQAKGKVMSEEMLQLTEVGIPAWEYLADALGTDVAGAQEKVTAGAVDANTAIEALQAGMNRDFGGMMAKQATTLTGVLSNLSDSAESAVRELYKTDGYQELVSAVSQVSDALGPLIEKVMPSVETAMRGAAGAISGVASAMSSMDAGDIDLAVKSIAGLAALGPGLIVVSKALGAASVASEAFAPVMGLFSTGAASIAESVPSAMKKASSSFSGLKKFVGDAGAALQLFAESPVQTARYGIDEIASAAKGAGPALAGALKQGANASAAAASALGSATVAVGALGLAAGVAALAFVASGGDIKGACIDISTTISGLGEVAGQALTGIAGLIPEAASALEQLGPSIASAIQLAAEYIGPGFQAAMEELPALVSAGAGAVIDAVVALAPNMLAGAIQLFSALVEGLTQTVPLIAEALPGLVEQIGAALQANGPSLLAAALQLFQALVDAAPQVLPALLSAVPGVIQAVAAALPTLVPVLLNAAVTLFTALVTAVPQVLPSVLSAVTSLIMSVVSNIPGFVGSLLGAAITLFTAIATAVPQVVGQVLSAVGDLLSQVFNAVTRFDLASAGRQLVQGLANGIKGAAQTVINAIGGVVNDAISWAKGLLGIASPSKVFRAIGRYTGEGLELGIRGKESSVRRAMGELALAAEEGWSAPSLPLLAPEPSSGYLADGGRASAQAYYDRVDRALSELGDRIVDAVSSPVDLRADKRNLGRLVKEVS